MHRDPARDLEEVTHPLYQLLTELSPYNQYAAWEGARIITSIFQTLNDEEPE